MGESGISRETIARVLNHVDRGPRATGVYDVYDRAAEKQTALEAWEQRLLRILAEQDADGDERADADTQDPSLTGGSMRRESASPAPHG